jgi:hypothetical protein
MLTLFFFISVVEGGVSGVSFPGGPGGYGSSKILSTFPLKTSTNPRDEIMFKEFIIKYNIPIIQSTGNFSVYQVGNPAILKQTIPATNKQFVTFENDIVKLKILDIFSKFTASYFITVDDDFVKEKSNDQNVIGIRENVWNFTGKFIIWPV